jgi:type I restriction enzyme R subunit
MLESSRFRYRNLPHWDVPGASYFVTSCLEGSIPAQGLLDIERLEQILQARKPPANMPTADWQALQWKTLFRRVDHWLDCEPAARFLEDPALAKIVSDTLLHFAGERYEVFGFVVMPSHFHWVFRPLEAWVSSLEGTRSPRERIMKSIKSYSATTCNRHRGTHGTFWQEEAYDHWVRDVDELERIVRYIELNPVTAGLVSRAEDWLFSSARLRIERGVELGMPIGRGLQSGSDRSGGD